MFHPFRTSASPDSLFPPPFGVISHRLNPQPNGDFLPMAHIAFGPVLRTSGFLRAVSPEELQTLLLLLSFVTPNGHCQPLWVQMAEALPIPKRKLSQRLGRLTQFRWQGQPLILETRVEREVAFLPSWTLASPVSTLIETPPTANSNAPPQTYGRKQVIDYSRARYARPRMEVERQIARLNGWPEPPLEVESSLKDAPLLSAQSPSMTTDYSLEHEKSIVRGQLLRVGLNEEQADSLLERFDLLRIRRQLSWLNYHRGVRNRAGFLMAAIADNYEPPLAVRLQQRANDPLDS